MVVGVIGLGLALADARHPARGHSTGGQHAKGKSGAASGRGTHMGHGHNRGKRPGAGRHGRARGKHKGNNHKGGGKANQQTKTNPKGNSLTDHQRRAVERFAKTGNLNGQEKQAVNNVLSGSPLSADDRQSISNMLAGDRPGLTPEVREALSQALNDDAAQHMQSFAQRILRVHNNTGERLRVWVQYRTLADSQTWTWQPADPRRSRRAVVFDLNPGAVGPRGDSGPILASRVRVWAQSASGRRWLQYQDEDYWLVSETDRRGNHAYEATEEQTWPITFPLSR
jgi:hypothetical protein